MMWRYVTVAVGAACLSFTALVASEAADLSKQEPINVVVQLGNEQGEFVFKPDKLTFETGKLYKLILINPSNTKHYLSGLRFASAVWTRKVETAQAEIKGSISEIELKPGGQAEWYFVPVKAGSFKFGCTIPSHREAGMLGNITIM